MRRESKVVHLVSQRLFDLTPALALLSDYHAEMDKGLSRAAEALRPAEDPRAIGARRRAAIARRMDDILPGGRNFH